MNSTPAVPVITTPAPKVSKRHGVGLYRYFTDRNGKRHDAYDHGYKCWPIGRSNKGKKK